MLLAYTKILSNFSFPSNQSKACITPPKRLNNMITAKEVTKAVQKMTAHNKRPGNKNTNVELIKYTPEVVHQEISKILNGIFETNNEEVKRGTGLLLPLPKPKKAQGPVKNLWLITLLKVIRQILSKTLMNRTEDKINGHPDGNLRHWCRLREIA